MELNEKYFKDIFTKLLSIDSTTSQYKEISSFLISEVNTLGYEAIETHKGGVIVSLGGEGSPLVISAHVDDIGLMVRKINPDGTLNVCAVGGLYPLYCMGENVRIYTHDLKVFSGSVCRCPDSIHVTEEELRTVLSDYRKNVCVVIDADVKSKEDVISLGINSGDIIALDARTKFENGYIKSRFIDDKAQAAILLAIMKEIKDKKLNLNRKVYAYFSMYEEIGHGTSFLPSDTVDFLALDIAPTGPDQTSDERKVSIFAKDSRFPYHMEMKDELIEVARKQKLDYCVDVFTPHYGSDGDVSLVAGYDIRHACIGPGTHNSHGYERTHMEGIKNTYKLALAYITKE